MRYQRVSKEDLHEAEYMIGTTESEQAKIFQAAYHECVNLLEELTFRIQIEDDELRSAVEDLVDKNPR